MSDSHIIEIWGEAVGITVPDGNAVRFHAAAPRFAALDGKRFPSFGQARLAAVRHDKSQNRPDDNRDPEGRRPFAAFDLSDSTVTFWS